MALPQPAFNDSVALAAPVRAVSWPAVFAGAAGAAALSLILLILGTGLGLAAVSPWVHEGVAATTFGVTTIVWIAFTQIAASGMGGYLAGRLRDRWADTQLDEVYFRDTAHGFLAWAVATLVTAALLTSTIASIVGGAAQAGATVAAGGANAAGVALTRTIDAEADDSGSSLGYFVDMLYRGETGTLPSSEAPSPAAAATETTAILLNAVREGQLPPQDADYLAQRVAQRTGMSPQAAQQRVSETFTRLQTRANEAETAVRETADQARRASAHAALWLFVSLLIGAFCASLAATFGGRQRDAA